MVTSFFAEIERDSTTYEVRVLDGDPKDEGQIKVVARIANVNFMQARSLIKANNQVVFKGRAPLVAEVRDALSSAGLSVQISPEFPY